MNKKVLTVILLGIATIVVFSGVFITLTNNKDGGETLDPGQELARIQQEEAEKDEVRMEKYDSISESIQSEDYGVAAQASYELGRDSSAYIIMRLQAYGTCVYTAGLSDNSDELKEKCYKEGLELSNELEDQEAITLWQQNLEEQYTGISTNPASGGESIADENAIQ